MLKTSMQLLSEDNMTKKLAEYLLNNPVLYPILQLAKIVCLTNNFVTSIHQSAYNFLLNHSIQLIDEELQQGVRQEGDWSIQQKLFCSCKHCSETMNFLQSNDQQKIWPIAQDIRKHIMEQFKGMCIAVGLEVLKKGSPHKLVITKSDRIYKDSQEYMEKLKYYHDKLTRIITSQNYTQCLL